MVHKQFSCTPNRSRIPKKSSAMNAKYKPLMTKPMERYSATSSLDIPDPLNPPNHDGHQLDESLLDELDVMPVTPRTEKPVRPPSVTGMTSSSSSSDS